MHLLGAVAGWGSPATRTKETALTLVVHYKGGAEERIELVNGVDITDHAGLVDVPGSARTSLVSRGQLRYLWRDLGQPGRNVERLSLISAGRKPAPLVAAVTIELPDAGSRLAPGPILGGAAGNGR